MNDSYAGQAVILIVSLIAFIVPFMFFLKSISWGSKAIGKMGQAVQNGMRSAANTAAKTGKKAAMNSKYGQAAQQFMAQRKQIGALKGREALRGSLEKNPSLMKIMGGVGGQKFAARHLDSELRRHDAEQVGNLQQGLTSGVAGAIASKEDIGKAMRDGYWAPDAKGKRRKVEDTDRAAVAKLQSEGYIDSNYGVHGDSYLARASLGSIMSAEIATPQNVAQLAGMVGKDKQQNAYFTEMLQSEAGKHGYKNLQYASVSEGQWDPRQQYSIKESGDAEEGARKVVASGLSGINKDALDSSMDTSLLKAITEKHQEAVAEGRGDAFIRQIAEQTKHIDKEGIVSELAKRLNTDANGNMKSDSDNQAFLREFQDLRSSIKSGGAIQAPARFSGSQPTPQPAPTPAPPPQQQLIVPHSPQPAPQPPRPRQSNFPPSGPPANNP